MVRSRGVLSGVYAGWDVFCNLFRIGWCGFKVRTRSDTFERVGLQSIAGWAFLLNSQKGFPLFYPLDWPRFAEGMVHP